MWPSHLPWKMIHSCLPWPTSKAYVSVVSSQAHNSLSCPQLEGAMHSSEAIEILAFEGYWVDHRLWKQDTATKDGLRGFGEPRG